MKSITEMRRSFNGPRELVFFEGGGVNQHLAEMSESASALIDWVEKARIALDRVLFEVDQKISHKLREDINALLEDVGE